MFSDVGVYTRMSSRNGSLFSDWTQTREAAHGRRFSSGFHYRRATFPS